MPKLTEVFITHEAPLFGGQGGPVDQLKQGFGALKSKFTKPKAVSGEPGTEDAASIAQRQKQAASTKQELTDIVRKNLGVQVDPGKTVAEAVPSLADLMSRIDDLAYVSKITQAFTKMVQSAKMIRPKQEGLFRESLDKDTIEKMVKNFSDSFLGKNKDDIESTLRKVLNAAATSAKAPAGTPAPSPQNAAGFIARRQQQAKAQSAIKGAQGTQAAATATQADEPQGTNATGQEIENGRGGNPRTIRNDLLSAMPNLKRAEMKGLALQLSRAANKLSIHLANHPASDAQKVKAFSTNWKAFVKLIGSYVPKRGA